MRISILVILTLSMQGCSNHEKSDFGKYLGTLSRIETPIRLNQSSDMDKSPGYDKELFEKYKQAWSSKPYGIIFYSDSFVTIIEYTVASNGHALFIITYGLDGEKIDSMNMFGKTGKGEYGETIETALIKSD